MFEKHFNTLVSTQFLKIQNILYYNNGLPSKKY